MDLDGTKLHGAHLGGSSGGSNPSSPVVREVQRTDVWGIFSDIDYDRFVTGHGVLGGAVQQDNDGDLLYAGITGLDRQGASPAAASMGPGPAIGVKVWEVWGNTVSGLPGPHLDGYAQVLSPGRAEGLPAGHAGDVGHGSLRSHPRPAATEAAGYTRNGRPPIKGRRQGQHAT
jgi:hypothetical protein